MQQYLTKSNVLGLAVWSEMRMGVMVIVRNERIRGMLDPAIAETMSCREELSWLKSLGLNRVILESDTQLIIQSILGSKVDSSYFGSLVDDCRSLAKDLGECLFVFVKKSTNQIAHVLARVVGFESDQGVWTSVPPSFLINVLTMNKY